METQFLVAVVMAIAAFVSTRAFGSQFGRWLKTMGAAAVMLPMLVIFTLGMLGMLQADAETAKTIADSTIERMVTYVTGQLPGIIISDMAGILVGTAGAAIFGRR